MFVGNVKKKRRKRRKVEGKICDAQKNVRKRKLRNTKGKMDLKENVKIYKDEIFLHKRTHSVCVFSGKKRLII